MQNEKELIRLASAGVGGLLQGAGRRAAGTVETGFEKRWAWLRVGLWGLGLLPEN